MLCPMSSNSTLLCPDVQSGGNDWSRCGRNHFLDLLSKMKNTSEYTNKFDSTDIYIYPGSQPQIKKWWFFLDDDKPYYQKMVIQKKQWLQASSIRDLLITQMEVTFSPLKRSVKTPKRGTWKNLVYKYMA